MITASGIAVAVYAMRQHDRFLHPLRFACLLGVALVSSRLKLKLPGVNGNMSVNLPFILVAVSELTLLEALVVACASTLVQSISREKQKLNRIQLLFNCCNMALAVGSAGLVLRWVRFLRISIPTILLPAAAAGAVLLAQTVPVAAVISLTDGVRAAAVWHRIFLLSFPYYLASAGISSLSEAGRHVSWQPLLLLPVMFMVYCSYREYFRTSRAGATAQHSSYRAAGA